MGLADGVKPIAPLVTFPRYPAMPRTRLLVALYLLLCVSPLQAETGDQTSASVVAEVVQAAEALLESLDDSLREQILFQFDDKAQKQRWSNLPVGMSPRKGVRWGDLNEAQQDAVLELIKSSFSEAGYRQVVDNVEGDQFLKDHRNGRADFGWDDFYIAFVGKPSTTAPWMWQFGGHHLALNVTVADNQLTMSPCLTGGQPMEYEHDGKQVRQMAAEIDKAFELINSLSPAQLKQAVLGDSTVGMNFGPGKEGSKPKQEGICAAELKPAQRKLLLAMIGQRMGMLKEVHAKPRMEQIERDLDDTWFSWYGSTTQGEAATYRVQGPTVVIEFAAQRNSPEHVHAMYRDPTNDYGARLIQAQP